MQGKERPNKEAATPVGSVTGLKSPELRDQACFGWLQEEQISTPTSHRLKVYVEALSGLSHIY